jgi:MFS family permease
MTSQLTNILFLQIWGRLGDRFSNKAVLSLSGPLFLLAVLAWGFTTMPEHYFLTIPLLFTIHILSGISTAGVTLGATNISLKLSPHGTAHAYMTVFGLAGALTGAVAPLVGGVIADFFALRELSLSINWSEPARQVSVYALNFRALDFLFGIAFLVGFYSLNRLARVKEEGEVTEGRVVEGLVSEMVTPFRSFSTAAGIRRLAAMPVHTLRRGFRRKENGRSESET